MSTIEQYYFGQGKLSSRPFGTAGRGGWRWWGDVSKLDVAGSTEKLSHKESYSGQKATVRSFSLGSALTISGTLHQLDTLTLGELLYGVQSSVAGGAVVGENIGTVAVGDIIKLDYPGVTGLSIVDSAGTPAEFSASLYELDPRFGSLEILSLPTPAPTWPLVAAYSHAGHNQVAFFNKPQPILEMRYEGVNLAENEAPVIVEFYKVGTEPLQGLALIQDGNSLAGNGFSMEVMADTTRPMSGPLGRYGRFIQVAAA